MSYAAEAELSASATVLHKKESQIFLYIRKFRQKGAVAMSYIANGLPIYS
jgi:hypothetical protein